MTGVLRCRLVARILVQIVISRDRLSPSFGPLRGGAFSQGVSGASEFSASTCGCRGAMTHRLHESLSDEDFRNLARLISACTLGLWAFAAGLLIGTFLFS